MCEHDMLHINSSRVKFLLRISRTRKFMMLVWRISLQHLRSSYHILMHNCHIRIINNKHGQLDNSLYETPLSLFLRTWTIILNSHLERIAHTSWSRFNPFLWELQMVMQNMWVFALLIWCLVWCQWVPNSESNNPLL